MATFSLSQPLTTSQPASQRCVSIVGWGSAMGLGAAMWWMLLALI